LYSKEIFKTKPYLDISGDILNPGRYDLKHKMRLSDLILEAGGISPDIKTFRAEIARLNEQNSFDDYAEIINLEIINDENLYLDDSKKGKYLLKPYDYINIRSDPYFVDQKTVEISGEIYYPGEYIISKSSEYVTDIIKRAGGLTENSYPLASSLVRGSDTISISFDKIIKRPRSRFNFVVQDGDIITIGSKLNLVKIQGGVNAPGNYQYFPGKKLKDYVKMAGGLTDEASKWATYITYPNGNSQKVSFFKYSLRVKDGSIINVGLKDQVEPFSFTSYVTNLTSIYADFTQAVLMMKLLLDS